MSFRDFLIGQGLSVAAARLLTLGFDWELGSAAWWLLDELNMSSTTPLSHIKGGNDLLPRAFADRLENTLHFGSPVRSIGQDNKSAWVVVEKRGERQRIPFRPRHLCPSVFGGGRLVRRSSPPAG
jgi:monoamine oxidase